MKNKIIYICLVLAVAVVMIPIGTTLAISHIDYSDPDWECKKWIGIAKQDYTYFLEDSLKMAEKKCGFSISEFID
jgi:hypothetical protein